MGQFAVETPDGRPLRLKGRKGTGLLAYILYHRGTPVPRARLMDLFWSDRDLEQARASLRQCTYEIRQLFQPEGIEALVSTRDAIAIDPDDFVLDLWDESGHYDPSRNRPFLEDLDDTAPVFDDWLGDMRRVIRAAQLKLAEDRLFEATQGTDSTAIEAAAEMVIELDRTNELAVCTRMNALAAQGRLSTAKAEYRKLVSALAEDGFEVSPSTAATYDRLTSQFTAPAPANPVPAAPRTTPVLEIRAVSDEPPGARATRLATQMADEIATKLAGLREITVTRHGGDTAAPADFSLECHTVPQDGSVLCFARMTDLRTGILCWSLRDAIDTEKFFRDLALLADQGVPAILSGIERAELQHMAGRPEASFSAYDHYLRARFTFFRAEGPTYMQEVEDDLEAAIEKDPAFVPAYAHLIQSYNTGAFMSRPGLVHDAGRERALILAERLLSLDSKHAASHIAMAWCQLWKRNFPAAERCIETAISLGTYDAHRLNAIGTALVYLGRPEEGIRFYDEAQERMQHELDYQRSDYGEAFYLSGDYDRALSWLDYGETRNRYRTWFWRMLTLAQAGRLSDARLDLETLVEDVAAKWAGAANCDRDTAVKWYLEMIPLRRTVDRDRVLAGMAKLGIAL